MTVITLPNTTGMRLKTLNQLRYLCSVKLYKKDRCERLIVLQCCSRFVFF